MKWFCAIVAVSLGFQATGADVVDGIEAVVHDSVISRQEVESLTRQALPVLRNQYRGQPELLQKKLEEVERDNREQLVQRRLILHEFKTAGYSLPDSVLDELVNEKIQKDFGDRMTLTKTLQSQGLTMERFRQQIKEEFIRIALVQ